MCIGSSQEFKGNLSAKIGMAKEDHISRSGEVFSPLHYCLFFSASLLKTQLGHLCELKLGSEVCGDLWDSWVVMGMGEQQYGSAICL